MPLSSCTRCSYCCNSRLDLIKHSFGTHSLEHTFRLQCDIKGCLHCFKFGSTFSSFKTHANRNHPNWQEYVKEGPDCNTSTSLEVLQLPEPTIDMVPECLIATTEECYVQDEETADESCFACCDVAESSLEVLSFEHRAALLLLNLKEKYSMSQKGIDFTVNSVDSIVDSVCNSVKLSVQKSLLAATESDAMACFDNAAPFDSLRTEHQQSKFYREKFGLVEPVTIELGTYYDYKKSGPKRRLIEKKDTFQYVPLIQNLEWMFQNLDLYKEVFQMHTMNNTGFLYDFRDGTIYKHHPLFSSDPHALQIIIYYDDVEPTNPLGSSRGRHKLGLFYFFLANINPQLRSVLRCTQLFACVKTKHLEKYGFDMVLRPFIEDANKLYEGVQMNIRGQQKLVRGAVLFALADTLASHSMGGFKVGVGFSLRKCRMCLATKEQLSSKFRSCDFVPRTPESYDYHCALLDGPLSKETSTIYGINGPSPLNDLTGFHVVDQLPQDIMHVLFEGIVPYELSLLLTKFITDKKFFLVVKLNDRIASFQYSTQEAKNIPAPVKYSTNGGVSLSQTSSQMWTLAINLPLMIGDLIPEDDEHWECLLLLLDIIQFCTVRVASSAQAGFLEALIHDHHQLFIRCYPGVSLPPKPHYMVHFPQQIIRTGPLCNTWCMRMEAKNSVCKQIASNSNFKNVCYSVAKKHQHLLCAYLQGDTFFDREIEYGPVKKNLPILSEIPIVAEKLSEHFGSNSSLLVSRPKWISQKGMKYHHSDYVIIGWQADDLPSFGCIKAILEVQQSIFFHLQNFETIGIDRHYHSFCVASKTAESIVSLSDLADPYAFQGHQLSNGNLYITFRSHIENIA